MKKKNIMRSVRGLLMAGLVMMQFTLGGEINLYAVKGEEMSITENVIEIEEAVSMEGTAEIKSTVEIKNAGDIVVFEENKSELAEEKLPSERSTAESTAVVTKAVGGTTAESTTTTETAAGGTVAENTTTEATVAEITVTEISMTESSTVEFASTDNSISEESLSGDSSDENSSDINRSVPDSSEEITDLPSTDISSSLKADFTMSVTEDIPVVKAGQQLGYEILLENTGDVNLESLELRSFLDNGNLEGEWLETNGLIINQNDGTATLSLLEAGSSKTIVLMVEIPEEWEKSLEAEFLAKTQNPLVTLNESALANLNGYQESFSSEIQEETVSETVISTPQPEILSKSVSLTTEITPLKIEFTVNKWADRAAALPGDTITYQICIRNTGERSLHSVLTTEKFQSAGLKAQFQEKEGVILNGEKTQALISEIKPGEAFGLYATVTLPEDFEGGDILNEVTVVTRETGETSHTAQATVTVKTPVPTEIPEQTATEESVSTNYDTVKAVPQTEDLSETEFWAGAFGISCLIVIGIYWFMKAKSKR